MDTALTHWVDALAGSGPAWLLVVGVLLILAFVAVKALPSIDKYRQGRLEIEMEREKRKAEEVRLRDERDRENARISTRSLDVQQETNAVVAALSQQMAEYKNQQAVTAAHLEASRGRSAAMGKRVERGVEIMEDVAQEVHEIHRHTVRSR